MSETRGAQRQLVLDVSMLDSVLFHLFPSLPPSLLPSLPSLSLPIHYHLPVNPQTALLQSQPNDQLENSTSCNQNSSDALKLCINSFHFQQSPIQHSGEGKRSDVFSGGRRKWQCVFPLYKVAPLHLGEASSLGGLGLVELGPAHMPVSCASRWMGSVSCICITCRKQHLSLTCTTHFASFGCNCFQYSN